MAILWVLRSSKSSWLASDRDAIDLLSMDMAGDMAGVNGLIVVHLWLIRWWLRRNVTLHVSHRNGCSSWWITRCAFNWFESENFDLHLSHAYGFSPVWTRKCRRKFATCTNCRSQCSHYTKREKERKTFPGMFNTLILLYNFSIFVAYFFNFNTGQRSQMYFSEWMFRFFKFFRF